MKIHGAILLFIALAADFTPLLRGQPAPRVWTDNQGRSIEAAYAGRDGDTILITDARGNQHRVPLDRLSAADQAWVAAAPAPVISEPINQTVAEAAARIDTLIDRKLEKAGIPPNQPASDETFVRRAHLDIAGRIPTRAETVAFLNDTSARKRSQLIHDLLHSDGYSSHLYNYFAGMLRVRDPDNSALMKADPYVAWIKEQIRSDRPYDAWVRDMLTATGKLWSNGATGYLMRDSGMVLDNLANTFAVFLGTDVACAQCHDHPFSDWTQMQFYELASFFGATITRDYSESMEEDLVERLMAELHELNSKNDGDPEKVEEVRELLSNIEDANRYEVRDIKENRVRLPEDYAYKNARPGAPVKPKFIRWPGEPKSDAYRQSLRKEERLREAFAAWMTHPDNPRFAMTIANRMWQRAFGLGAGEPVRNIDNPDHAANPELLRHLGREMIRLKFSLRDFLEIVYNTRAWQREATTARVAMGESYHFQGPLPRRMTAEQTWDSFMTLVLGDPDAIKPDASSQLGRAIDLDLAKATGLVIASKLEGFRRYQQMLETRASGGLAMAGGEDGASRILHHEGMQLLRAADLPQPAPEGHFLREFGQGPRDLIDGNHTLGSVPQVLMLVNGPVQAMLTRPESLLMREMLAEDLPKKRVETAFLTMLSRRPTDTEKNRAFAEFNSAGDEAGAANMVWALINSLEFLFVQ
jgi:hypothetical protein